ncbi:MAG: hypothetical protein IMW89_13620 [Ktedonobacteraceae bacterium]|nr:hypothetical protein [Ktedonobacteraceae bacterium]
MTTYSNQSQPSSPKVDQAQTRSTAMWWQRKGILGRWLNLTAPPRPADMSSLTVREYVRKAELTSVTIIAIFAFLVAITSNNLTGGLIGMLPIVLMAVMLAIAGWFNRKGHIYIAAYTIVISLTLLIGLAVITYPGGLKLTNFIIYDLFTIPIFASALIIHKRASLIFALLVAIFVLLDYSFHPHALITGMGANRFDEVAFEITYRQLGWWSTINRNLFLILFSGLFGWLAAYSFEKSLMWAEQASNDAAVAHALADYKERSAQELSLFLSEVVDAFVAQANNQTKYLQPRPVNDPFHQAVLLLNERLRRFERLRKQQNVWASSQIVQAIQQLTTLLRQIAAGTAPLQALMPQHFHSQVETIDELAGQIYALLRPRATYPNRNTPPPPGR